MRADAVANRRAIVVAARDLIAAEGPEVPLTSVAERAGVGIATLYRNFPDRTALLLGIAEVLLDDLLATAARFRPQVVADPVDAWPRFVRALADLRLGATLPALAGSVLPDDFDERTRELRDRVFGALEAVLAPARVAGVVRDDVTPVRLHLGLAMLTRPLPPPLPPDVPDPTDWLIDCFLRGLRR